MGFNLQRAILKPEAKGATTVRVAFDLAHDKEGIPPEEKAPITRYVNQNIPLDSGWPCWVIVPSNVRTWAASTPENERVLACNMVLRHTPTGKQHRGYIGVKDIELLNEFETMESGKVKDWEIWG